MNYMIQPVSVGDAGLTQRPAIVDQDGHTVQVFNARGPHGRPEEILDHWTDGSGVQQFKLRMTDGYVKVTRRPARTNRI